MPSVPHSAPPSLSHIDTQLLADLQATSINSANGKDRLSPAFLSDHSGPETTIPASPSPRLARPATWGSSWGVVTLGRGFNWNHKQGSSDSFKPDILREASPAPDNGDDDPEWGLPPHIKRKLQALRTSSLTPTEHYAQSPQPQAGVDPTCLTASPLAEKPPNPLVTSVPSSPKLTPTTPRPVMSRSSSIHSSRRRFSGKRVSLIAGQLSMIDIEPPSPPPLQTRSPSIRGPRLPRFGSTSSFVSVQSVATPPDEYRESYLGERSIDEFVIEEEIGRGAYGLVKQAREIQEDGTLGVSDQVF
jgi:protein-serine/threonine kinase